MTALLTDYTSLITSEHADKPKFMAMVSLLAQWGVDRRNMLASIPGLFDIDSAIGQQLDFIGEWVGVKRTLSVPLSGVYFSFDTTSLGFDQGTWLGPYDPTTGLVSLPDSQYRILLYATIAANNWDGTVPDAYNAWSTIFQPLGYSILISDNQDMTMDIVLVGPQPDAVTLALFVGGYLNLRPAGVGINNYYLPSVVGSPVFGFDVETTSISGFDVGGWVIAV
ncbi:hypothetical protein FHX57_006732 [Paraburkholderia tropica]|uniref:DUF2612 domain-containing protein n=1 Tax=Paraburkholderia tropica TaxID=92647 RepID=UPI00161F2FA5|nr:DUF2612 domain-containing protein [Paraburkholderia tropica]MBB3004350.1 hypothetical protein [Paraburkholderia tropica]